MGYTYSEEKLKELFRHALDLFNGSIESDISPSNTVLAFFTPESGVAVYEAFCTAHFPEYLQEPYRETGYFERIAAQAFVGEEKYGILFRSDLDFPPLRDSLHVYARNLPPLLYKQRNPRWTLL